MAQANDDDLEWAHPFYLGRYADRDARTRFRTHILWSRESNDCRQALYVPDQDVFGLERPVTPQVGTFFHYKPGLPKVCVLGNCQALGIGRALALLAGNHISVAALEIMAFQDFRDEMLSVISSADMIVSCKTYSTAYQEISADSLRRKTDKVVLEYCPIHFTGLHPDAVVLGHHKARVQSAVGAYCSLIVASSFLHGLSVGDCVCAFNNETYEGAGFYEAFAQSQREFEGREEELLSDDIRISRWFVEECTKQPLLLTINHPTSAVFLKFASLILDRLSISFSASCEASLAPSLLTNDTIWPVYSDIALRHKVRYRTNMIYWRNMIPLNLEEFVWRSYHAHDRLGRDILREAVGELQLSAQTIRTR